MVKSPRNVNIGEYYNVPCVRDIPIIGPAHIDAKEMCVTESLKHYHIDYRFYPKSGNLTGIISYDEEITIRRFKCIDIISDNGQVFWGMIRLIKNYRNYVIDVDNPVCPHQSQNIVNENGKCSAHGLCWNMQTGRLKYVWPLYIRFKGQENKKLINDAKTILLKNIEPEAVKAIVEMLDSENQVIGEHDFQYMIQFQDSLLIKTEC